MQATFYFANGSGAVCSLSRFAIGILICMRMQGAPAPRRMQSETSARYSWQSVWHDDNSVITPSMECSKPGWKARPNFSTPVHPCPTSHFTRRAFRATIDYLFGLNGKEFYVRTQSRLCRERLHSFANFPRSRLRDSENLHYCEITKRKKRNARLQCLILYTCLDAIHSIRMYCFNISWNSTSYFLTSFSCIIKRKYDDCWCKIKFKSCLTNSELFEIVNIT